MNTGIYENSFKDIVVDLDEMYKIAIDIFLL